jgi:hypothetical protein
LPPPQPSNRWLGRADGKTEPQLGVAYYCSSVVSARRFQRLGKGHFYLFVFSSRPTDFMNRDQFPIVLGNASLAEDCLN